MHAFRAIVVAVFLTGILPLNGMTAPVTVTKADKCPVCGMFVAKYPDFLAQITFKDGSYAVFDGVKDMFKYYFDLKKYNVYKEISDIAAIYVTDYYDMTLGDGKQAWYVVGSDVFGPMGRELMPFVQETDAKVFMQDHSGKQMIRFEDVNPDIINGLD